MEVETVIRTYYMKINLFSIKKKKNTEVFRIKKCFHVCYFSLKNSFPSFVRRLKACCYAVNYVLSN